MKLEAPPSRYRVVERGGQLVVIDSVAGGTPLKAKELLPHGAGDDASVTWEEPGTRPASVSADPSSDAPKTAILIGSKRDDRGRLLFTTARWYDAKGPRALTLSDAGEKRLGRMTLTLIVGAMIAVILFIGGGVFGWMILFVAFMVGRQARPLATAWLDRLALS